MINLTKPKMGCNTPLAERNFGAILPHHGMVRSKVEMCHVLLVINYQRCSIWEGITKS